MTYTIHDSTEETYCDWCGRPLYVGDKVYTDQGENYVFCAPQDQRAFTRELRERDTGYRAFEYLTEGDGAAYDQGEILPYFT